VKFSIHGFFCRKNAKVQKRGKINLIGRLQLTTERMREEENEGIVQLRILRTQVCNTKIECLTFENSLFFLILRPCLNLKACKLFNLFVKKLIFILLEFKIQLIEFF
jgi:hypothetical protein